MTFLLISLLAIYTAGIVLPLCFPGRPRIQNLIAHGLAAGAGLVGIVLGLARLLAPEPWTASAESTIPFLSFAIRLDPLASFFLLTISLAGLAASIYAIGYLKGYCQLKSNRVDFLPRARSLNVEQSMSHEFVWGLNFVQIHLTRQYRLSITELSCGIHTRPEVRGIHSFHHPLQGV
jgi:hypothetical protein